MKWNDRISWDFKWNRTHRTTLKWSQTFLTFGQVIFGFEVEKVLHFDQRRVFVGGDQVIGSIDWLLAFEIFRQIDQTADRIALCIAFLRIVFAFRIVEHRALSTSPRVSEHIVAAWTVQVGELKTPACRDDQKIRLT